jgi:hypothetical protein
VNPLASRGNKIDLLNVMSYDASNAYDPVVALTAYRAIYSGQINMGVEVRHHPHHNGTPQRTFLTSLSAARSRPRPGAVTSTLWTPSSASAMQ